MVKFRKNASRGSLYALAVENSITVAEDADRETIIAALEAANSAEDGGEAEDSAPAEDTRDGAESATDGPEAAEVSEDHPALETATGAAEDSAAGADGEPTEAADPGENIREDSAPAEDTRDGAESATDGPEAAEVSEDHPAPETATDSQEVQETGLFVYVGPSISRGRLKENAVFNGTLEDVKAHLAEVIAEYPQVARLIVPADKLAAASVKVKTPGNIAHKHYQDIVSAMRSKKEV